MRLPRTFQVLAMTMGDAWNGKVRSSVGAGLVPARGFGSPRGATLWGFGHLVQFEVWDLKFRPADCFGSLREPRNDSGVRGFACLPSPGGRELEGGEIHPHLNPLPSRERKFIRNCVEHYKRI